MGKTATTQRNGVRARSASPPRASSPERALPPDIRRILIVGAGGFGREVWHWAKGAWPDDVEKIAGFLSADPDLLHDHEGMPPILANPGDFSPTAGDGFLLAIGIAGLRRRVAEQLEANNARFLTLIHPTAVVAPTASVGPGSILCPYTLVSDSVRLGRFSLMNYHSSAGHDAKAGDFTVFSPYATLGGAAEVGDDVFLGLHAAVGPGKQLGPRTKVSANSAALCDAPADSLIYGVPGRVSPLMANEASS